MRRRFLSAALVLLFLAHALFYFAALGYDAVDDAYISFRYAQNAILGHGLVFNPGERVEGFTNFLWTALLTPVVGANLDVGRVGMLLGVLFALGTLWLTIHMPRWLGVPPAVGWLAALLLTVDGSFALWSVSGLETALFTFLLTAGAAFYLREFVQVAARVGNGLSRSALFFALAAMTRPEAAAVFALTVAHQCAWRVLGERRLFNRQDILRALTFALLFAPYWLVRWRYYHSFLPNSFYAKVAPGGPSAQITRGWDYVTQFVNVHLGWWILLPALLALALAGARCWQAHAAWRNNARRAEEHARARSTLFGTSYLALVMLAYTLYIIYVGGDWSVGRFFVPILPLAYLLIATGLVETARSASRLTSHASRLAFYTALVLAAALTYASSWQGEYGIFVRGFDAARATAARETMGRWLKAHVPRGTLIAVDAAGQVPYFAELPALDMFGINDLHIGRLSVPTLGQGTPGHEKFDLGYIIMRAPRYVIIYGTLFDSVTEYRRAPVKWTDKAELEEFLTLYERKQDLPQ